MAYLYLSLAIVCEVVATSALKLSEEFTKPLPTLVVVIGYGLAFYLMALTLRSLPLGITYAIWCGIGIVLITVIGAISFGEVPDTAAIIGTGLIVAGVVTINMFSTTVNH